MTNRTLLRLGTLSIAFATAATVALAQSKSPSETNNGPNTTAVQSNASTPAKASTEERGFQVANTATMAVRFVTVKPADFMTSRLVGATVYNNQSESLGEISDLVVDNGKTISGVVVSVGGFLGMGESYVVLDPSTVVLNDKDGTWRAFVDTTKDNLKAAPKFKYSKKSS
ncbi:PRC-barrel domain protein [Rhodopseudomonas palustris TIE-1]|uniref:PRC-barrel domain-containing protein n=1 Tax=Rhodopseudomonas palustris TaxID=1076 RepID=UPI000164B3E8|nr:PRC-barrel domain-containing protein [Rhodopseudomonas palustris]ACF02330.1 PRC-barrel domain protein [Rhodopseudomonas palustris TIE-1]